MKIYFRFSNIRTAETLLYWLEPSVEFKTLLHIFPNRLLERNYSWLRNHWRLFFPFKYDSGKILQDVHNFTYHFWNKTLCADKLYADKTFKITWMLYIYIKDVFNFQIL